MINFSLFAILTILFWFSGITVLFFSNKKILGNILIFTGIGFLFAIILKIWIFLQRPPLQTLGETRLWYAFFLQISGIFIFLRWKHFWFLFFTSIISSLFLIINVLRPENFEKNLAPALQSFWFLPHVIVYIAGYALLAGACLVAVNQIVRKKNDIQKSLFLCDNFIFLGFAFLTLGLIFGAIWAKTAWGHYWTWDPKEIWAFLCWTNYLIYIHLRQKNLNQNTSLYLAAFSFLILLFSWFGINSLTNAQNSLHIYN